ncbi:MAG TPA: sulfatase-like hydrolase/transferase [Clostridiales bacterium]|jgi:phosphoglycerol transferase MdoB-like AlkP superfamily enzyme|nr:sulfatase-like hydrolase/transferase [Clostridiales bacterium]HQP70012.1 sulfatase-like hydrolase/transferase [Clostridiales bacterium]
MFFIKAEHIRKTGAVAYFFLVYIYVAFCLSVLRLIFLLRVSPDVFSTADSGAIIKTFLVGQRFDTSIISYSLLMIAALIIIMFIISLFKEIGSFIYKTLIIFHILLLFIILMTQIVDIEYFRTFSGHLTFRDLIYLNSGEVYGTVYSDYPVITYLSGLSVCLVIYYFYLKQIIFLLKPERSAAGFIIQGVSLLITAGILIIGARGGISTSNLNWGSSVFSDNETLNQASLNGIFTIGKSYDLYKKSKTAKKAGLYKDIIIDENLISDLVLKDEIHQKIQSENVLRRITNTGSERKDLNVVLILLEGWTFESVNRRIGEIELIPFFNSIVKKGVFFDNCYSTGTRSNKGIESVICSVPSQYGISALKKIESNRPFFSIPVILKNRGYDNMFIYGGDPEFDNMKGFLRINGISKCIGMKDIDPDESASKWGAYDKDTFERTLSEASEMKEPFFQFIFTLSSHEPFDLPSDFPKKLDESVPGNKYLNSLMYADTSLEYFISSFSKKPFYKNTVFVLISDHGRNRHFKEVPMDREKFHIPFLIYSESGLFSDLKGKVSHTLCSQYDVLPTLMGLLGGEYENASWGRDLIKNPDGGYAYMTDGDKLGLIINDTLLVRTSGVEPRFYGPLNNLIEYNKDSPGLDNRKHILGNILYFSTEYLNRQVHGQ